MTGRMRLQDSPIVTIALVMLPVFGLVAFAKLLPGPTIGSNFERVAAVSEAGVLSAPGRYVLTADIVSSEANVISITSDAVDLDLNGKTITCEPKGDEAETLGINVLANRNVTIRNGAITNCVTGVRATSVDNLAITSVDFSETRHVGAYIGGENSRVTKSVFARIGGFAEHTYAIGINVTSDARDCLIEDNVFEALYRQSRATESEVGEGVAIIIGEKGSGCRIHRNTIVNDRAEKHSIGIWIGESANATVTGNTLIGFERGIAATGNVDALGNIIWLQSALDDSYGIFAKSGSAEGNLVVGYANPIASALTSSRNAIRK